MRAKAQVPAVCDNNTSGFGFTVGLLPVGLMLSRVLSIRGEEFMLLLRLCSTEYLGLRNSV